MSVLQELDVATTSGWRIGLLVLALAIASGVVEFLFESVGARYRHRKGLLRMLSSLKNELFLVGFLSLLLNGVQVSSVSVSCLNQGLPTTSLRLLGDWLPAGVRAAILFHWSSIRAM